MALQRGLIFDRDCYLTGLQLNFMCNTRLFHHPEGRWNVWRCSTQSLRALLSIPTILIGLAVAGSRFPGFANYSEMSFHLHARTSEAGHLQLELGELHRQSGELAALVRHLNLETAYNKH